MAKQLSENYGDRAWTVCALSEPTGEQWPVHGVRLSPNYPYIEAEVLYATRHEYACTAVDVLARRTRLAFVDAQAALAVLPRVIEMMGKELGWSRARRRAEYARGVQFLGSMGLAPGVVAAPPQDPARSWRTWLGDSVEGLLGMAGVSWTLPVRSAANVAASFRPSYSRTKFEAGEVEALKALFERWAVSSSGADGSLVEPVHRLRTSAIQPALVAFASEWPGLGYEGFREADYRYVFAQEGLRDRADVDLDEFVEVRWRVVIGLGVGDGGADTIRRRFVDT